jgi:hypothetical protein
MPNSARSAREDSSSATRRSSHGTPRPRPTNASRWRPFQPSSGSRAHRDGTNAQAGVPKPHASTIDKSRTTRPWNERNTNPVNAILLSNLPRVVDPYSCAGVVWAQMSERMSPGGRAGGESPRAPPETSNEPLTNEQKPSSPPSGCCIPAQRRNEVRWEARGTHLPRCGNRAGTETRAGGGRPS